MEAIPQFISAILGAFAPIITSFINKNIPTKKMRYIVALIVSVIAGFVGVLVDKGISLDNILSNIGTAFIVSQTIYMTYFRDKVMGKSNK